ncbi:helix-turn-helix domain-containing protein [Methylobacterium sp. WL9]|nr:helix-turn-helix domain-containing protein [Methylobacterium sp. WL9]TXN19959.1 helix-turn-helix domain-containing protein [Methylobacterium sp. WL9]
MDHTKTHEDAYRGRKPNLIREQSDAVSGALGQGRGMSSIAAATGLTRQTIYRIKENTAEAEAALARWS